MLKILSVTLKTSQLEEMRHFYEILGFQFEKISVDKGSEILKGRCENLELSLLSISNQLQGTHPVLQLAVQVKSVLKTCDELRKKTSAQFMLEPMDFAQGLRSIVMDPDGNALEISQSDSI